MSREELRNIRVVEAFNVAQAKREQRQLQKSARLSAESSSPVPDCRSEAPCSLGLQAAAEQALHFFSAATLPLHAASAIPVAVCARKQKAAAASMPAASPPAVSTSCSGDTCRCFLRTTTLPSFCCCHGTSFACCPCPPAKSGFLSRCLTCRGQWHLPAWQGEVPLQGLRGQRHLPAWQGEIPVQGLRGQRHLPAW